MSNTSSAVKDRYNKKAYDQVIVRLPKGMKDKLKAVCDKRGISMNSIFVSTAEKYIGEQ